MKTISIGLLLLFAAADYPRTLRAQDIPTRTLPGQESRNASLHLRELYRVGSISGTTRFGRVMSAALARDGRLLVADDQQRAVFVFGPEGEFLNRLSGSDGGGFERPWLVASDAEDSVFVYDPGRASVMVFSPALGFVRSFRVNSSWLITSIRFGPNGEIVIAAFGPAEQNGIHILQRDGTVVNSWGTVPRYANLAGYDRSLLGGTLDLRDQTMVYSRKSPYELLFFSNGRAVSRCLGPDTMTTPPNEVVDIVPGRGAGLNWSRYRHSAAVLFVDTGLVLNVIMDPGYDARVVDLVTTECSLVRRSVMGAPITLVDSRGGRIAAVSNIEYPEVIVYEIRIERDQ